MVEWKKAWNKVTKAWDFIWNDDSALSWVLNIIIAIILIKFIIYPALGFILQTGFPIVAVVSGSMEHDGSFDDFWNEQGTFYENRGINKTEFLSYPFKNGFNTGDIMILYGTKPENLKRGDIIVFQSPAKSDPIIHRIIDIREVDGKYHFTTKGDHNQDVYGAIGENDIIQDRVYAQAVIRVPFLGWVKIVAFNAVQKIVTIIK